MKTYFFLFILTFSLASVATCLAQNTIPADTAAAAIPNFEKVGKGVYTSSICGYTVTFPEEADGYSASSKTSDGTLHYHFMSAGSALFISYNISCIEYPRQIEAEAKQGRFFDDLLDRELAQSNHTMVIKRGEMMLEGHPGRFFTTKFSGNRIARYRVIAVGNKLYYVFVITPGQQITEMSANWFGEKLSATRGYEAIGMRFLDSFSLVSRQAQ